MFRSLIHFLNRHFLEASLAVFLGIEFSVQGLTGDIYVVTIGAIALMVATYMYGVGKYIFRDTLEEFETRCSSVIQFFKFYMVLVTLFEFTVYLCKRDSVTLMALLWHCSMVATAYSVYGKEHRRTKRISPAEYEKIEQ